jgi:hypothetical protein
VLACFGEGGAIGGEAIAGTEWDERELTDVVGLSVRWSIRHSRKESSARFLVFSLHLVNL